MAEEKTVNLGYMNTKGDTLAMEPEYYGPFWKYVNDPDITDCDWNGRALWLTDVKGNRIKVADHGVTDMFIQEFAQRVANHESKPFNKLNNLLEAETGTLRISILHESVAPTGRSICLRKTLAKVRITATGMVETNYLSRDIINLLANLIKAKLNVVIGGEPGAGKTEFAKYLSGFVNPIDRVITIEDSPEWHFAELHPENDSVEMQVIQKMGQNDEDVFSYAKAIKTCLRQNPKWIMLSEARSIEAKYLIEAWSTGVNGITTIHTDDVRKIPSRLLNMMSNREDADRLVNDVYEFANVVVLVRRKAMPDGTAKRYIDQVGFLYRDGGRNGCHLLVKDGKVISHDLPADIAFRMQRAEIKSPFENETIDATFGDHFVSEYGYSLLPSTADLMEREKELEENEKREKERRYEEERDDRQQFYAALTAAASKPAVVMPGMLTEDMLAAKQPEPEPEPAPEPEPEPEPVKPAQVIPTTMAPKKPSSADIKNIRKNVPSIKKGGAK